MPGIYIHVPFCRHKCSYCDFVSFPDKIDYAEAYMACLYKELKMRGEELKNYEFDTVYFGGGTPSYIPPKLILGAMNQIRNCFRLTKDAEVTLELNPGTIGEAKVKTYLEAGINRFSIGLQTAIDEQLEDLGRIHNARDYVFATKLLKGQNFSTDVMLGLKNQTKDDIAKTIELAAACGSKHISMYALTARLSSPIISTASCPIRTKLRICTTLVESFWKRRGTSVTRYLISLFQATKVSIISTIGSAANTSAWAFRQARLCAAAVLPTPLI